MRLAVFFTLSLCACGLSVVGTATTDDGGVVSPNADGAPPVDPIDGGSDGDTFPPPPPGCQAAACAAVTGWTPVAVAIGASAVVCPADYEQKVLKGDPVAGAGACGCEVDRRTQPSCETGLLSFTGGSNCGSASVKYQVKDHECVNVSNTTLGPRNAITALAPMGAACTAKSTRDDSKLRTAAVTLCAPTKCPDALCGQVAPAGFKACILGEGDRTCSVAGFSEKHVVGREVSMTCSDCTCTPTDVGCTNVKATFYDRNGCNNDDVMVTYAPGVCTSAGNNEDKFIGSVDYRATPVATFTLTGPKTAMVDVNTRRTLCCAP